MNDKLTTINIENIAGMVHIIHGQRVLLSHDLAHLYGVETKVLVQAVKRNIERFPEDFMFQLTADEDSILKSQFVTSSWGGARRARPFAFTEQGVAMLSSVLRSQRAIEVNITIMRAFVQMRRMIETNKDLAAKIDVLEKKYDGQFRIVFKAIRQLMKEDARQKPKIGF